MIFAVLRAWARFWSRFGRAFWNAYRHGALGFAKGAAYSALLALFPLLTVTTTVLVRANAANVSEKIVKTLFAVVPPGAADVVRYAVTERGARPLTLPVIAVLLAIWAGSGVMMSLIEGFQAASGCRSQRGIVKGRLMAMLLVLATILPVVGASALVLFGERAERWLLMVLGLLDADEELFGLVRYLGVVAQHFIAGCTIVFVNGLLYYLGPDTKKCWRSVWPGAWVSAALWLLSTGGFGWWVRNIAQYNVLYGSIGAVIALLVWIYVLSVICLAGFEFNVTERERV